MSIARNTLFPIQALRGFAAIAVSAVHFNDLSLRLDGRADEKLILYPLASGVDIFFVISGFIMVYASGPLFGRDGAPLTFLIKRIARIAPIYWVTTGLAIALENIPVEATSLLKSLFFIPFAQHNGLMQPLYGVGWTLNFEMFFYSLFAIMIRYRRKVVVIGVSILLFIITALGCLLTAPPVPLRFWSDPIVFEFVFGMTLAIAYREGVRLPRQICVCMMAVGALAVWGFAPGIPPSGYRFLVWGVPAAMIVAGAMFQPRALPSWRLRVLDILGDASYSIYLIHSLVIAGLFRLWPYGLNRYPIWQVVIGGELLTIALSIGAFHLFERPINRMMQRVLTNRSARAAAFPVETSISSAAGAAEAERFNRLA
jgi:exopolysaccharide production protein ExoZ